MVEPVDVLGDGDLEVVDASPRSSVADELGLEEGVERLGEGVVIAVAGGANGGDRAGLGEALGVAHREVLDSLVRVVDQAVDVVAGEVVPPFDNTAVDYAPVPQIDQTFQVADFGATRALNSLRLGFTGSTGTTDQVVEITNFRADNR